MLRYVFTGSVSGDQMSGEVELREYGHTRWTAQGRPNVAGA